MNELTVVVIDLVGSVSIFLQLGNTKAAEFVSELIRNIGDFSLRFGGEVIKTLGDGVLILFQSEINSIQFVMEVQKLFGFISILNNELQERIKIGVDRGEVLLVGTHCFGDAVNVAIELCAKARPGQILITDHVIDSLPSDFNATFRNLGRLYILGKVDPVCTFEIKRLPYVDSGMETDRGSIDDLDFGQDK